MKTWMGLVAAVLGLIGSASVSGGDKGAFAVDIPIRAWARVPEYDQDENQGSVHVPGDDGGGLSVCRRSWSAPGSRRSRPKIRMFVEFYWR